MGIGIRTVRGDRVAGTPLCPLSRTSACDTLLDYDTQGASGKEAERVSSQTASSYSLRTTGLVASVSFFPQIELVQNSQETHDVDREEAERLKSLSKDFCGYGC